MTVAFLVIGLAAGAALGRLDLERAWHALTRRSRRNLTPEPLDVDTPPGGFEPPMDLFEHIRRGSSALD